WPPDRRAAKVWADSLRRAGVAAYGRAGPGAAMAIWRRALSRAMGISDTAGIAAVLGNLGAGFLREGRLDSATVYLERSRALAAAVGDIRVEANAVGTLAGARADRGDLAAARDGYARALSLRERIGDSRGVAADHNNLGLLAQTTGDADEARRQFEAALNLNRRDGRDEVAATNLVNLAALAAATGDFAHAEALYRDALATWRVREQWADAADAVRGLGELELRRGDYPAARTALQEAVAIYGRTGPLADALAVRRELAGALAAAGELQAALDQLRRAQRLADSASAPPRSRACRSVSSPPYVGTRPSPDACWPRRPPTSSAWAIPSAPRPRSASEQIWTPERASPSLPSRCTGRGSTGSVSTSHRRSPGGCTQDWGEHGMRGASMTKPRVSCGPPSRTSSGPADRSPCRSAARRFSPINGTCTPSSPSSSAPVRCRRPRLRRASGCARAKCSSCCSAAGWRPPPIRPAIWSSGS